MHDESDLSHTALRDPDRHREEQMKNGRAMKGHRRVTSTIGVSQVTHRAPPGGWDVSCICGWNGGNWPNRTFANAAYREHLDYQIDQCPIKCKRCGIEKPLSQMRPDYRYICLDCFSKIGNEWQKQNPNASARHKRNHHLLKKFGVTLKETEQLLAKQGGLCAICRRPINDSRGFSPHVDHDHITGEVRGILCFNCNVGMGAFGDDADRLRAAAEYLERGRS